MTAADFCHDTPGITAGRATLKEPLAVQTSPDKSMNCHDTTTGFTVQREFVAFVVLCQLDPAAQPYIRFLSDNTSRYCLCLRLVVMIVNRVNAEFSDRGLSPHEFMPMLGVHTSLNLTRYVGASRLVARRLAWR